VTLGGEKKIENDVALSSGLQAFADYELPEGCFFLSVFQIPPPK
jgi:hypothetical protein